MRETPRGWVAEIKLQGRSRPKHLGIFNLRIEALLVYDEAMRKGAEAGRELGRQIKASNSSDED